MITSILSERQEEVRSALERSLAQLRGVLERLGDGSDCERVDRGLGDLDTMFRIGLTGGAGAEVDGLAAALVPAPVPRLSVSVASPGEAAAWGPGVDLALFVTSATHPLPPDERPLLVAASDGAVGVFVVVDGVEMLRLADDVTRMEEAVALAAERVLGSRPEAAGVSTALAPGRDEAAPAPSQSLVPALATRVVGVLRSPPVVRPKLRAPLELARQVAGERRSGVEAGLVSLADDLGNLEVLEAELGRFDRETEAALREATAAVEEAVAGFGERAGGFLRRRTRPFSPAPALLGRRRLEERFGEEAVADLPARLRKAARRVEERMARAAEAGRAAVVERLASFPTARSRRHPPPDPGRPAGVSEGRGGDPGPVESALEELRPRLPGRGLVAALRRGSGPVLVLLVFGVVFAVGSFLALPPFPAPVLGAGLGGGAVLAAAAVLRFHGRRLRADLEGELEELRAAAAAALAAAAEGAALEGRGGIRAPVAAYASAVVEERDRLAEARETLDRLVAELDALRGRVEKA